MNLKGLDITGEVQLIEACIKSYSTFTGTVYTNICNGQTTTMPLGVDRMQTQIFTTVMIGMFLIGVLFLVGTIVYCIYEEFAKRKRN